MAPPGEIRDTLDANSGDRDFLRFSDALAISTRTQLAQHALCCYESAFLSGSARQQQGTLYAENQSAPAVSGETAMPSETPTNSNERAREKAPDETPAGTDQQPPRGRLDAEDFDIAEPLSNFRSVDNNLSRSGRPLADQGGIDQILDKLHPGKDKNYQREHTVIIELRDEDQQMDDPAITALNKREVLGEEAMCKASTPPIEYHRFKMQSKLFQSPEKINEVVETIEAAVAAGKKVSMHCFHGSDRSGLISAAYKLNNDPTLLQELKNNPDKAYKEAARYMIENGCDPASYTTLFQSLRQYVNWKHEQLNGRPNTVDGKNPVAVKDAPLDAAGQARVDAIAKALYADPRFATDPINVYKEQLSRVADEYDPATNKAFYNALKQKYVDGPPPAAKPQKSGALWLPHIELNMVA